MYVDPLGLIEYYDPSAGDNNFYPSSSNCGIVGDCRSRLDEYADRLKDSLKKKVKKPSKNMSPQEVVKKMVKKKLINKSGGIVSEILQDMICASMNAARCDGDFSEPLWPSKLPPLPKDIASECK